MTTHGLSEREQALVAAARRETGAARATTPLDQPTVLGWDHPAAAAAQASDVRISADKWSRIAVLMETERRTESERRARLKQRTLYLLLGVAVALLAVVMLTLRR